MIKIKNHKKFKTSLPRPSRPIDHFVCSLFLLSLLWHTSWVLVITPIVHVRKNKICPWDSTLKNYTVIDSRWALPWTRFFKLIFQSIFYWRWWLISQPQMSEVDNRWKSHHSMLSFDNCWVEFADVVCFCFWGKTFFDFSTVYIVVLSGMK